MAVNRRVAIIGSGLIGRSWAAVFAGGGFDVTLYDAVPGVADQARTRVSEDFDELSAHGLVKDAKDAAIRVRTAASLAEALDGAGYVQENSPETLKDKCAVFAEPRPPCRAGRRSRVVDLHHRRQPFHRNTEGPPPLSGRPSGEPATSRAVGGVGGRAVDCAGDGCAREGDLQIRRPGADRRAAGD